MNNEKNKSVSDYLLQITHELMDRAGYPYPESSGVDPNLALAYGLAIGSIMWIRRELDQHAKEQSHHSSL